MSHHKPIIGITLDSEPAGGWSKYPWYALRENYCGIVARHGGVPIALPHEPELADALFETTCRGSSSPAAISMCRPKCMAKPPPATR